MSGAVPRIRAASFRHLSMLLLAPLVLRVAPPEVWAREAVRFTEVIGKDEENNAGLRVQVPGMWQRVGGTSSRQRQLHSLLS